MPKKFPIWVLALIVVLVGLVNAAADYWHLYFYIWWLDIPMHLVGGFWVGLSMLTYFFAHQQKFTKDDSARFAFIFAAASTLVVAIGWEVFEWCVDRINGIDHLNLVDTLADICNGMIGATLGAALFVWRGYNKTT